MPLNHAEEGFAESKQKLHDSLTCAMPNTVSSIAFHDQP